VRRKRLGGDDAGVENLFGQEKPEYASQNTIASMAVKKAMQKQFVPVRQQ
jgi:hypothetical protein